MQIIVLLILLLFSASAEAQNWTLCANENSACSIPAGQFLVRYGAGTTFVQQTFTGPLSVNCNNTTFGDPLFGTLKHCDSAPVNVVPPGLLGQVAVTGNQTLCASGYITTDLNNTVGNFWAGNVPCVNGTNVPLLSVTFATGRTVCTQKVGTNFDLWLSTVLPCVHP